MLLLLLFLHVHLFYGLLSEINLLLFDASISLEIFLDVKTKYLPTLDRTDPSPMWNQARPRRLSKKLFCKLFHKLNPIFPNQSTLSNQLPFHHVQYKIWISICQIFGGANKIMVWGNWVNASKVKLNFKPGRGYLINCRKLSFKITFFTCTAHHTRINFSAKPCRNFTPLNSHEISKHWGWEEIRNMARRPPDV